MATQSGGHATRRPGSSAQIRQALAARQPVFVFSAQKLGGEIDLPETDASPGAAVDMSVIEVLQANRSGHPEVFGKHMFYEIQTADFHGSAKLRRGRDNNR